MTWRDGDGNQRTRAELNDILEKHKQYLDSPQGKPSKYDTDPRRANLSGAVLSGFKLGSVNLKFAELERAQLDNVWFFAANLEGANLYKANLSRANLDIADLTDADLSDANLTEASLSGTKLKGTVLMFANLKNAKFHPSENPSPQDIGYAENLDSIRYDSRDAPLQLKKSLKDAGFLEAERQLNTAIRRHQSDPLELVFFDWTCEFGANPSRALVIILFVWLICGLIYWVALHVKGRSGLYLVVKAKTKNHVVRIHYPWRLSAIGSKSSLRWLRIQARAFGTAMLFSTMSAFRMGYRELNLGQWLGMLQPREFDIKATRKIRVISGIQSLLSIYLLALWLLSTFGRPFDIG